MNRDSDIVVDHRAPLGDNSGFFHSLSAAFEVATLCPEEDWIRMRTASLMAPPLFFQTD